MKDLEGGVLGDEPLERAILGDDWMAAFLTKALPHIRVLLACQRVVGPQSMHVAALDELLQQYRVRHESRLESLAGAVDAMDAETDRLRAAILEKVYAWQAFPAPQRQEVVTEVRQLAIELGGPPGAYDSPVVMAALAILMDNLPGQP